MATAFISIWEIFSPFSHSYLSPYCFNLLICRFAEENTRKRRNLFIFNCHSMVYSIVLGLYYSSPQPFSTGNPLFACEPSPHPSLLEDEFEAISWQLLSPTHTFSPRSTETSAPVKGFLWMSVWLISILGTLLTPINFVRFD